MEPDTGDPGRVLYEERQALLPGLWMPPGPDWEELSEEDRERWRGYARSNSNDGDPSQRD